MCGMLCCRAIGNLESSLLKAFLCPVLFPCRSVLDLMHPALHTFGELAVSRKLSWLFRLRLVGQKSYKTIHIPYPLPSALRLDQW